MEAETGTIAWFGIRLKNGKCGIFDMCSDQARRLKHLASHVPRELAEHALSLLGGLPDPDFPDVLCRIKLHTMAG